MADGIRVLEDFLQKHRPTYDVSGFAPHALRFASGTGALARPTLTLSSIVLYYASRIHAGNQYDDK